jgi:hypothetical protein
METVTAVVAATAAMATETAVASMATTVAEAAKTTAATAMAGGTDNNQLKVAAKRNGGCSFSGASNRNSNNNGNGNGDSNNNDANANNGALMTARRRRCPGSACSRPSGQPQGVKQG